MPHYAAMSLGYFEQEGVPVTLATAEGPGGVSRALLAGEADLALSGPVRALALADRGESRLVCVAEVASRAGFYLLGRGPQDLDWRDLRGRRVLVPAEPPTPRLCLEYLLERHEVSLASVDLAADLPADLATDAFLAGRADFVLLGQPAAEALVAAGQAHVAASLGAALGPLAFSAYLVTPRTLADQAEAVAAMVRALGRVLRWLRGAGPAAVAAHVAWAFPAFSGAVLEQALRRALGGRQWPADPVLRRPALDALQEVLLLRGFIHKSHAYDEVVASGLAEAATRALLAEGSRP